MATVISEYIQVQDPADYFAQPTLTLSAWVNPGYLGRDLTIVGVGDQNEVDTQYGFTIAGGKIGAINYGVTLSDSVAPTLNTWVYVALTYDGSTVTLYVNGTQVSTSACPSPTSFFTSPLLFLGDATRSYIGLLDQVRLASSAYSAAWIQTEYASQNSPSTFYTLGPEITQGNQTIQVAGLGTKRSCGGLTFSPNIARSLTGIPSGETLGSTKVVAAGNTQSVNASGIASRQVVGVLAIQAAVSEELTGVDTAVAIGSPTLSPKVSLSLAGIPNQSAFGLLSISGGPVSLSTTSASSARAFGSATLTSDYEFTAESLISDRELGEVALTGGPVTLSMLGIPAPDSLGSVGVHTNGNASLRQKGIASGTATGVLTWSPMVDLDMTGVPSPSAIGSPSLKTGGSSIAMHGLPSGSAVGLISIIRRQLIPTLTWATPAAMQVGELLADKHLNAKCQDTLGVILYTPPIGTLLPGGKNKLAAAFTPHNTEVWTTAYAEVQIEVTQ